MQPIDAICSAVQECDAKPMIWKTLADIKKKNHKRFTKRN